MQKIMIAIFMLSALLACTPSTNIRQPLSVRPQEPKTATFNNGAIYQAGYGERPLFEDKRARNVGDTIVIVIAEVTSASGKSSSGADHSGSFNATTPAFAGSAAAQKIFSPITVTGSSAGKLSNKSDSASNNTFSGTITATVIELLANGNLLVSGEKQVAINHAHEYVRFSGVVNPATISGNNTVVSTQVADAQIEYKGANKIDLSAIGSMLSRVFMSVMPF